MKRYLDAARDKLNASPERPKHDAAVARFGAAKAHVQVAEEPGKRFKTGTGCGNYVEKWDAGAWCQAKTLQNSLGEEQHVPGEEVDGVALFEEGEAAFTGHADGV